MFARFNRRIRLPACCDSSAEKAQAFARRHKIPTSYTRYEELLDREALSLAGLAEQAHICLGVNYQYRYDAGCYALAQAARRGDLGAIHAARCNVPWHREAGYFQQAGWHAGLDTAGSGSLPRAAQFKNVVIAIYNITSAPALYVPNRLFFTHAWLPRDGFDQVLEQNGWIFARLGQGYLALRSQRPFRWQDQPGEDQNREIIADGRQNIWICELGRQAVDGPFEDFVARISRASLEYDGLQVVYHSPSRGKLEFGWQGPLCQDGQIIELGDYPRYDNPYLQAGFGTNWFDIRLGGQRLVLDFETGERSMHQQSLTASPG